MSTAEVVLEGETFHMARRSLMLSCELFAENLRLLEKPYRLRSRASEAHFRLFLPAIEGATMEIGMETAIDIESLSRELQFVELGRQVDEFASQHPHVEVVRLNWRLWTCRGSWRGTIGSSACFQTRTNGRGRSRTCSLRARGSD
jgi:hypothetical protein